MSERRENTYKPKESTKTDEELGIDLEDTIRKALALNAVERQEVLEGFVEFMVEARKFGTKEEKAQIPRMQRLFEIYRDNSGVKDE